MRAHVPFLSVLRIGIVSSCVLVACTPAPRDEPAADPVPPEALERARAAARALTGDLVETLVGELHSGGPVEAVKVCSETAQQIVATHSAEGLVVRRVSLRVRNPLDAPDPYEAQKLDELEVEHREGRLPDETYEVVGSGEDRTLRYLKPIVVQDTCLRCHGEIREMDPEIRAILEQRYPEDRAVGYRSGDLRGAVSVTVDLN